MGWDKLCIEHFSLSIWNQETCIQSKAPRTFLLSAYGEGKLVENSKMTKSPFRNNSMSVELNFVIVLLPMFLDAYLLNPMSQ